MLAYDAEARRRATERITCPGTDWVQNQLSSAPVQDRLSRVPFVLDKRNSRDLRANGLHALLDRLDEQPVIPGSGAVSLPVPKERTGSGAASCRPGSTNVSRRSRHGAGRPRCPVP